MLVWSALALCAVTVFGAMTWLTRNVLAVERERSIAEARADLEERTRLALWRMDAVGAVLLLEENQLSPVEYRARQKEPFGPPEINPLVNLHFQARRGSLISPEADSSSAKLKTLRKLLSKDGDIDRFLNTAAETGEKNWQALKKDAPDLQSKIAEINNTGYASKRASQTYQDDTNRFEKVQRAKVMEGQDASAAVFNQNAVINSGAPASIDGIIEIGSMRGVFIDQELFLLRCVGIRGPGGEGQLTVIQGAWMDAAKVRKHLLDAVADLLPGASLEAMVSDMSEPGNPLRGQEDSASLEAMRSKDDDPLALVSLPFRLHRDTNLAQPPLPVNKPLLVGWIAVVLAVLATSLLVRGVMRLSERRASFVSAVTHELRTPLTTFRLYSDMLESGAVKEEKRGHYLSVLSREADRLSHLVENVLAFSRIERGNARSNVREVETDELLEGMRERFESRLATAGLALDMNIAPGFRVRADTAAVEHILFNLIDNAAKYAAAGDPPVLRIRAREAGRFVELIVSDHGPGIAASERGRIFHAFHKSAREAAETQPGVGLGLALSRRLARAMGGDLKCVSGVLGACFILSLPSRRPD